MDRRYGTSINERIDFRGQKFDDRGFNEGAGSDSEKRDA
jgi:hypothetical protein